MRTCKVLTEMLMCLFIFSAWSCGPGVRLNGQLQQSLYGNYTITGISCGPMAATGAMALWVSAPTVTTVSINTGNILTETWTNPGCTIVANYTISFPVSGQFVAVGAGNYQCSGSSCPSVATSLFGGNVCGGSISTTPTPYAMSPSNGAVSGGSFSIAGVSGTGNTQCSGLSSGADPVSYTSIKQ